MMAYRDLQLPLSNVPESSLSLINSKRQASRPRGQLLKWVGNKQRFAEEIIAHFPERFGTYFEPFVGSGAVLATLAPKRAVAGDAFPPIIELWKTLRSDPARVKKWYDERWHFYNAADHVQQYERIKHSYNSRANGADLLFLSRACYGGIIRFRKADGYMSTPCGPHRPISPETFSARVDEWSARIDGTEFRCQDFQQTIAEANDGDVVYCDPPYTDSQAILYGAQAFRLDDLVRSIEAAKSRGAFIALSIDGTKKSGDRHIKFEWPRSLFAREVYVHVGRSMLRRLQMGGQTLEREHVTDRLLLTH